MSVVVRPVSGWRDRREFISLPYRLHSTSGVWVPPLRLERHVFLMRSQNAFFSHGDAQLFLAWRDGRVVGPHQRPVRRELQRLPRQPLGDVRVPRIRGRTRHPGAHARGGVDLVARSWPRPHGRADGLHDERRVRRADRRLRPDAVPQAAVAPAVLRRALRGGGAGEGRRPVHVRARDRRPLEDPADRLQARRSRSSRGTGSRSGACRGARCGATWTASPTSTTRPGARTGASCPSPSATWTSTRRRCSSSSTRTGSWSPRRPRARPPRWRSPSRTSTRCWPR